MYNGLVQSFQSIVKESLKLKNRWSGHSMDRYPIFDIIANDSLSSSDDEVEMILRFAIEEECLNSGGGSRPRQHRTFIPRDFVQATERIFRDYFAEPPLYSLNMFRMSRPLFLRIKSMLEATEPYFVQ